MDSIGQAERTSGDSRIFGAIPYVLGILIAIVIYFVKKEDPHVRFHAMQAILLDLAVMVASFALFGVLIVAALALGIAGRGVGFFAGFWLIWLGVMGFAVLVFIMKLIFAYKAYTDPGFRLPIIGKQAERMAA